MELRKNKYDSIYNNNIEYKNNEKETNFINIKNNNDLLKHFSSNGFYNNKTNLELLNNNNLNNNSYNNIINNNNKDINISNINEKDLFSVTKDNFFNTASTFFIKDYFNINSNDKTNDKSHMNNIHKNLNNKNSLSSINLNNYDINYKNDIDYKYNYYLSNLNKERDNKNNNNKNSNNYIEENEQIKKLLEEEKNIEDENIKRLTELRVKYLSSIKTFDIIKEANQNFNKKDIKSKTERNMFMNNDNINELNSDKINYKNSSFSFNNKLFKQTNSFNDIIQPQNDLIYNRSNILLSEEKHLSKNNYSNILSNIMPKEMDIDSNDKSNYDINNNKSPNQSINKIINNINQTLKGEFGTNENKDILEKDNFNQNDEVELKNEKNISKNYIISARKENSNNDFNKSNLNIDSNINNINLKDTNINMSIYERKDEKNNTQLYNMERNNNLINDFYLKYDNDSSEGEKHINIVKSNSNSNSIDYKSQRIYNKINNEEGNQMNHKIIKEKTNKFHDNKFEDLNKNLNYSPKQQVNFNNINENEYLNGSIKQNNNMNIIIENEENYNENINILRNNYKKLEYNYNQLRCEYNSLQNKCSRLLNDYKKEKKKRSVDDEKDLFNEYILKENNDLREINSNYEYIINPLINYINDINYYINKKGLKTIDLVKIKQNIRNAKYNQNKGIEEHPLYSFIQLLENNKNIIINDEMNKSKNSINNRTKSNPKKLNSYESIIKNYNLKNNMVFKSKNKTNNKYSKSISLTPFNSKIKKTHKKYGTENIDSKSEKLYNKNKGKMANKRNYIINKIIKKDS